MVALCLVAASGQDELHIQVIPEASMGPACRMNQTPPCDDYVQDEPYCPYKCSGVLFSTKPTSAVSTRSHIGLNDTHTSSLVSAYTMVS